MSHKFAHIKTLKELDDELHIASIRKDLLVNEISSNIDAVKSNFSVGGMLMTLAGSALPFGSASKSPSGSDKWENILAIATKFGGLIALIRAFRGRKK